LFFIVSDKRISLVWPAVMLCDLQLRMVVHHWLDHGCYKRF